MNTEIKYKYLPLLGGASIIMVALMIFIIGMSGMVRFPPVTSMEYIILLFGILGINFGRSSGKRLAYTIHDRDILLERTKGHGKFSSRISRILQIPIMLTAFTLIAWTMLVIGFSLSRSIVVDAVLIGYVRWLLIISMIILIMGSYVFYKARSHGKSHMLTLKGRILMEGGSKIVGNAMRKMDRAEDVGRDAMYRVEDRSKDMMHNAEDMGRNIVNRLENKEKEFVDRIKRKL